MRRTTFALLGLAAIVGTTFGSAPTRADAKIDAIFVVDQLVTDRAVSAIFSGMAPLLEQALSNAYTKGEARKLSQTSRQIVIKEFLKEFEAQFKVRMKTKIVDVYMGTLTKSELAGLREFLKTPAGAGFARKQPVLTKRGSAIGAEVGGELGSEINRKIGIRIAKEGENFIANNADREILLRIFPSR